MFDPNLKMICLKDKIHGENAKNANVLSYTRRISREASTKRVNDFFLWSGLAGISKTAFLRSYDS